VSGRTRAWFAYGILFIFSLFILGGIGATTWVILAGKSALELAICIDSMTTPMFGLVTLVVGYFFGKSEGKGDAEEV
jgi:hypothetical protein